MSDIKRLINDTAAAPLGEIIASVGQGVAQAQRALDEQALAQLEALYQDNDEAMALLRRSGWQPTFYTLPETEGEIKVALSLSGQDSAGRPSGASAPGGAIRRKGVRVYATPVDAGYQNRFGYQATIGASLRFRIVPVPPPSEVEALPVVAVPRLIAMQSDEAQQLLAEFRLAMEVDPAGAPAGVVSTQVPAPGELLRRGDVVSVTLEAGPEA